MAAGGAFAALSFIFESPLIAAVILIEATGIGGPRLPIVLVPGLLAAGIGSLVSVGMGSFTGLDSSDYALSALSAARARPPGLRRLRLDDPVRRRRRGRRVRDPAGRPRVARLRRVP